MVPIDLVPVLIQFLKYYIHSYYYKFHFFFVKSYFVIFNKIETNIIYLNCIEIKSKQL